MEDAGIALVRQGKGFLNDFIASGGYAQVLRGVAIATLAIRRTLKNPAIYAPFWSFFRAYAKRLVGLYGIVGGLGFTILAPIAGLLLIFNPGLLVSLVGFGIPHMAFDNTLASSPEQADALFLRSLEALDHDYASGVRQELATKSRSAGGRGALSRLMTKKMGRWKSFGGC